MQSARCIHKLKRRRMDQSGPIIRPTKQFNAVIPSITRVDLKHVPCLTKSALGIGVVTVHPREGGRPIRVPRDDVSAREPRRE